MLLLTFRMAGSLYAVEGGSVVEVAPAVGLRAVPHAPSPMVGLFAYRGEVVPTIDLGLLMGTGACRPRLSTRIVVVRCALPGREPARLGLVAEHVEDVRRVQDPAEVGHAMHLAEAPYLGPIFRIGDELVQVLRVDHLLSESLREALFGEPMERP